MLGLARRQPSALLLAMQLSALLLYPLMQGNGGGRALFGAFAIAVLGLVVLTVRRSPRMTLIALLLGVPATLVRLIEAASSSDRLLPYSSAIEAILYFYAPAR